MFLSEIDVGCDDLYLENLFWTSTPELKVQLTGNLVEGIAVTCRSKLAKIV